MPKSGPSEVVKYCGEEMREGHLSGGSWSGGGLGNCGNFEAKGYRAVVLNLCAGLLGVAYQVFT